MKSILPQAHVIWNMILAQLMEFTWSRISRNVAAKNMGSPLLMIGEVGIYTLHIYIY